MKKQKLLHIMMGEYNPNLKDGLDSVFECLHFNWLPYGAKSFQLQNDLLNAFKTFNPDIVFMHIQREDIINMSIVMEMAKTAMVFNWTGDVRQPLPQFYMDMGKHIHSTLFTNVNDVETCRLSGINADFLQVGFDSKHFNPVGEKSTVYPQILFLGSNYQNSYFPLSQFRHDMVVRLKNEFGTNFGVYGGNWGYLENGNITTYEEEGKAYRSCKIAINLSHFSYKRYSSDRMYRIMGSGAFCLSHNYPEIEIDFNVGDDLVIWNNLDELVQKIRFYIADENEAERNRIAANGCFKSFTNYTWHHFAQNLKKISENTRISIN